MGLPNFESTKLSPSLIIAINGSNDPNVKTSKKYFIKPTKKNEV